MIDESFADRFWRHVCRFDRLYPGVLVLSLTLLLVMVGVVLFLEPDSASYVIAVVDVVLLAALCAVTGALITACRARKKEFELDR